MPFLPLPAGSPESDTGDYIALLLGAIDDWLKLDQQWSDDDLGDALQRMEELKAWLVGIPNMSVGYIGEVREFAFQPVPSGWLLCEGQSLLRSEYPDLLDAIGLLFGAVDGDHFSLPDIRRKIVRGGYDLLDDLADTGGEDNVTLTTPQLPEHNHGIWRVSGTGSITRPTTQTGSTVASTNAVTQIAGEGEPHNNWPPYIVLKKAIYAGV